MLLWLLPVEADPLIPSSGFLIEKELTLIGRHEDCDIRIDSKSVSKMHCMLFLSAGVLLLRDLGSTNGTRINGLRVRRAAMIPNDQLGIANFRFLLKYQPEAAKKIDSPGEVDQHTQNS